MTKAPYIVYTPDEDFVLTKEDVNNGGGSSGGDTVFYIECIYNEQSDKYTTNVSFNDILNAYKSDKILILKTEEIEYPDECRLFYLTYASTEIDSETFTFNRSEFDFTETIVNFANTVFTLHLVDGNTVIEYTKNYAECNRSDVD